MQLIYGVFSKKTGKLLSPHLTQASAEKEILWIDGGTATARVKGMLARCVDDAGEAGR